MSLFAIVVGFSGLLLSVRRLNRSSFTTSTSTNRALGITIYWLATRIRVAGTSSCPVPDSLEILVARRRGRIANV